MHHDRGYKQLFQHRELLVDLVSDLVAPQLEGGRAWIERFDFTTLEALPTEHVAPPPHGRRNDLLWRVGFVDATGQARDLHVMLMLELQSTVDYAMPLRVQGYAVRIYERLVAERPLRAGERLPALLAVVLYNGKARWRVATSMAGLADPETRPAGLVESGPHFVGESYVLVDVGACDLERLPAENLMRLVLGVERLEGTHGLPALVRRALRRLAGPAWAPLRRTFFAWLRQALQRSGVDLEVLEDMEMMQELEERGELRTTLEERFQAEQDALRAEGKAQGLEQGLEQGREQGLEQGLEQGREQGLEQGLEQGRELLVRQVAKKFGMQLKEPVARLLAGIGNPDRLQEVGEWVVDCDSGSELLVRLEGTG